MGTLEIGGNFGKNLCLSDEDLHILLDFSVRIDGLKGPDYDQEVVPTLVKKYLDSELETQAVGLEQTGKLTDSLRVSAVGIALGAITDKDIREHLIEEAVNRLIFPERSTDRLKQYLNLIHEAAALADRANLELDDLLENEIRRVEKEINRQEIDGKPAELELLLAVYWSGREITDNLSHKHDIGTKIQNKFFGGE